MGHIIITRKFVLASAGEVVFKDGKIQSLNSNSGHYQPSNEAMKNAAELLLSKHGSRIFNSNAVITDHLDQQTLLVVNRSRKGSK